MRQNQFSGVCQLDAPRRPLQQLHAKLGFELADLRRDRRLCDMEMLGRARETALAHDGIEVPQFPEIHGFIVIGDQSVFHSVLD
nr:hypothetical protein [Thiomonas sp.]